MDADLSSTPCGEVRIRLFEEKDAEDARTVYLKAMLEGENSPVYQSLKAQQKSASSLYFYAQAALGAAIVLRGSGFIWRLGGGILVVSAIGILYAWRRNSKKVFRLFCMGAISGDMADIPKSYSALGSAFWVAEVISGSDAGKVVGCVGLAMSPRPYSGTAELRRMSVLSEYQGHGVGTRLLNTAITHGRAYNIQTITLSTSMYQLAAIQIYEAAGFRETKRVMRTVKFWFLSSSASLHWVSISL